MSLDNHINTLMSTRSIEELWDMHCRHMKHYGFIRLLYGFPHYRSGQSLGDPDDLVILSNHSKEYLDWFIGEEKYKKAPMVLWALANEGVMSWSDITTRYEAGSLTSEEIDIMAQNHALGVRAGYSISFSSVTPRSKGAIALTGGPDTTQAEIDAIWEKHQSEIIALNNVVHLKILSLPRVSPTRSLTQRQLEALHWVGDGKTTADTALLMGLTQATVEKHLRLAREVLSVETTAQAVLKAALQNQLFVVDYGQV
jgi:LuxR family transcriptional regulator, quorum-sensing system regulator SdiA